MKLLRALSLNKGFVDLDSLKYDVELKSEYRRKLIILVEPNATQTESFRSILSATGYMGDL